MAEKQAGQPHPTSVRLSPVTDELLRAEAKRTQRSRAAVLRVIADEGIRERAFPGIKFRGSERYREAWVVGAWDVWMMIKAYKDFGESIERMAAETELTEQQIRLAVHYYRHFREEIDEKIAENDAVYEKYRDLFPTFYVD